MLCGNCKRPHGSVAEVKACYTRPPEEGATEKQREFIRTLQKERGVDVVDFAGSKKSASEEIDRLLGIPRPAPTREKPPNSERLEDGLYRSPVTGSVLKVLHAVHGSGKQYVKIFQPPQIDKLNADGTTSPGKPTWIRGTLRVLRNVNPEDRLSLEEAKEYGRLYGQCMVCGRPLTDETSIEKGIGPVCEEKMGAA